MKKLLTCLLIFCAFQFVEAQPANDMCATATSLNCGDILLLQSVLLATDQSADVGCTMGSGVWYTITGTGDNITLDITEDLIDVEVAITTAASCVGPFTNVSCTDGGVISESVTFTSVPGTIYYIYIGDFAAGGVDVATFDLSVTCVTPPMPPANDMCATATVLACGDALIGEATEGAIDQSADVGCGMGVGVWYTIVGTGDNIIIDVTNDDYDVELAIVSATDCNGPFTNISCTDGGITTETGTIASVVGTTYYIYIGDFLTGGDDTGTFDLAVTCAPPVPGDECTNPIPYPGDVVAGTCVMGFDFTQFSETGASPSPSCDFGGDAVVWFDWTAPVVTAAGDPLDLVFDDGDGQTNDCDIGVEFYMADCSAPVSNCLGNVSGTVSGLVQGMQYLILIYDDAPAEAVCDFCLTVTCSAPIVTAVPVCQPGDEANFYVEVNVSNFGVGNAAYTVDIGGPQADITATGTFTYGPFPSGTPVDVVLTGVDDATCGFTTTGLDRDCSCPPDLAISGPLGSYCTDDAPVAITYAPAGPFTSSISIEFLTVGTFDNEIALGFYAGTFDDGSIIGLPPAGTGLLGNANEPDIEASAPGANDLTVANEYNPAPVLMPIALPNLAPGDYTIYLGDTFGDGWNGATLRVTDECGNVLATEAAIETISADLQDELAWINFTLPVNQPSVTVTGNGVVQTADPDGVPNSGDETYDFDPSQVTVAGCEPITETLTLTATICGVVCEETLDVQIFPPAQTPTITRDDDTCNYIIAPACADDVLDVMMTTAMPGEDPDPITVMVTTANGCMGSFMVDPALCPAACSATVALAANPTDACSTDGTVDICIDVTAGDAAEVTLDVDGTTATGATGDAQVCVTLALGTNQTCTATAQAYTVSATCANGDELLAPTAGSINVRPEGYTVVTAGDMMCGTLTAELQAADGSTCGTPVSFACTSDGETLAYDFTADADPMACTLPTLTGTLTCGMCACVEEITYNVSAPDCDMTGAVIELLDDSGTSLGTMALGMDGGSGTFGVQPCGDYIFSIMGAPPCYTDNGGDVGPRAFTTDGTGAANNQNFSPLVANIPTVGEWGLIILGLLMSITAVVGIRQRREEEVYG